MKHAHLLKLLSLKFPSNIIYYFKIAGYTLKPFQFLEFCILLACNKYLINWQRGFSKTFIFAHFATFTALHGEMSLYATPHSDQLDQFKIYCDANPWIDANPRKIEDKTFVKTHKSWYRINGKLRIKLTTIDRDGQNVSSGRFNNVLIDESALLMYYKKESWIYTKINGMLRARSPMRRIYASTPLFGSHFVRLMNDWNNITPNSVSWRNFENTPDNFVTDTPEAMAVLMDERAEAIRMGIEWSWICENLAIAQALGGAVFPNCILDSKHKYRIPNYAGFDFHGHAIGHIGVEMYHNKHDGIHHLWVVKETKNAYPKLSTTMDSVRFLGDPYYSQIKNKSVETYGFNEGYFRDARKYGVKPVNISGIKKHNLTYNLLKFIVHINRQLTPLLADDIEKALWDDPNIFKVLKKKTGEKYRNHYLDALFNGAPRLRDAGFQNDAKKSDGPDGAGGLLDRRKKYLMRS